MVFVLINEYVQRSGTASPVDDLFSKLNIESSISNTVHLHSNYSGCNASFCGKKYTPHIYIWAFQLNLISMCVDSLNLDANFQLPRYQ